MKHILSTFRLALGEDLTAQSPEDAARSFRLLSTDHQQSKSKSTAGLLMTLTVTENMSVSRVQKLATELLNFGRIHHFVCTTTARRREIIDALYRGHDCETLFMLDDLQPDMPIWWAPATPELSFDDFDEWFNQEFSNHYKNLGSVEFRKCLHRYVTSYARCSEGATGAREAEAYAGIDNPYFSQASVALLRKFGEQKVMSVLDDVIGNVATSTVDFIHIVKSDHDFAGHPMHWILNILKG